MQLVLRQLFVDSKYKMALMLTFQFNFKFHSKYEMDNFMRGV